MESTVTWFSQRSPVTQINGYSFLLPVIGAAAIWKVSGHTASIGLRLSIRTLRAPSAACSSVRASSLKNATPGTSAYPSVPSLNNRRGALSSAVAKRQNRGDARRQPRIPAKPALRIPDKIVRKATAGTDLFPVQIVWNGNVLYRAVEWGCAFPMNAKTLHREHPTIDYQILTVAKCSR